VAKITTLNFYLEETAEYLPLLIIEAKHFIPAEGWAEGKLRQVESKYPKALSILD